MDLIKLREVYEKVYRRKNFSFIEGGKEYTNRVVNVTFQYSIKEYNRVRSNVFVKNGWSFSEIDGKFKDCTVIIDGELVAIQTNTMVNRVVSSETLGDYFYVSEIEDNSVQCEHALDNNKSTRMFEYKCKDNIKTVVGVSQVREYLYENGFLCDGVKYIRFKRSAGSSRVGKCLFIDERLYPMMHKWEMCGLKVNDGDPIDLAALEAYIALTSSSIIGTVSIQPENILVINDYESTFKDEVIATRVTEDGRLTSGKEVVDITNSIWDGQSLMDISLFNEYKDKGMLLLRNRFFKSCCFNTNIQQFFADNNITKIEQLNGFTLAKRVEDVKLITTPSSIKYIKFGRLREWLKRIDSSFGVVKNEKRTFYFNGRMVQTHYQLLNSLQMSQSDVDSFLAQSIDYMKRMKKYPAVMRYHLKQMESMPHKFRPMHTKTEITFNLMGLNDKFAETKLYADFRDALIKSYSDNIRRGHICVQGNYSTLLGNPYCMLNESIGSFDGKSELGVGNVHSLRFRFGDRVLCSRSPHICQGNIFLPFNVRCNCIDKYFNLTEEILCINAIDENTLQRLSGADYDSDSLMITDNNILIEAAAKNYDKFLVPTSMVYSSKTQRYYTHQQKADLDIKTSVNKIGEIVNLSQELNSLLWDRISKGATFDDVSSLYQDISTLSVMSGIEIDKSKKEFPIDNASEYRRLKEKYLRIDKNGKTIKPNFFGILSRKKGFYDPKNKNYQFHDTTMDYVQHTMNKRRMPKSPKIQPFSSILKDESCDWKSISYYKINVLIDAVRNYKNTVSSIYLNSSLDDSEKGQMSRSARDACLSLIGNTRLNRSTMFALLKKIDCSENKDIQKTLYDILFSTANHDFYDLLFCSESKIGIAVECIRGEFKIYDYEMTVWNTR